jgi:hypothetical protein
MIFKNNKMGMKVPRNKKKLLVLTSSAISLLLVWICWNVGTREGFRGIWHVRVTAKQIYENEKVSMFSQNEFNKNSEKKSRKNMEQESSWYWLQPHGLSQLSDNGYLPTPSLCFSSLCMADRSLHRLAGLRMLWADTMRANQLGILYFFFSSMTQNNMWRMRGVP